MVKLRVEAGFLNETVPAAFNGKQVFICLLTERSDGALVDFRRSRYGDHSGAVARLTGDSAKKLGLSSEFYISAELSHVDQRLTAHIMCESFGER